MSHLMSLSGVKRTLFVALHESASDPKRTSVGPWSYWSTTFTCRKFPGRVAFFRRARSRETTMAGTAFTVFVIDKHPTSLNRLTRVLRSAGYKIKKYLNPNTFLDEHDWAEPGCVLLNL